MSEDLNLAIKIAMESQSFQTQMQDINRQMKLVQSEFEEASSKLGNFGDETEQLEIKSESLSKQLELAKQKVTMLTQAQDKSRETLEKNVKAQQELKEKLDDIKSAYEQSVQATTKDSDASKTLKDELEQLAKKYQEANDKVSNSVRAYDNYSTKVNNARRDVNNLENDLKDATKAIEKQEDKWNSLAETVKKSSDKIKDGAEKMKGVGEKISAAIVLSLGYLEKGYLDAQGAQGKIQASLGTTAEEAGRLGSIAQDVWKNGFGESVADASNAVIEVKRNLKGLSDNELSGVTQGAMMIADTFDQDVKDVVTTAGVMMKNFGVSGQDALDLITYGFQNGGDFSGELLDTVKEYSPQFASLGLSADKAMAMLLKGAEAGAFNLDKVGDSMKEFNNRAQDGSKTTADGFNAIGLDANDMASAIAQGGDKAQGAFMATITGLANMKDPLAQNQAGVALFGSQWEDVRSKVIIAMRDGQNGVNDFKGSTQKAMDAISANDPGMALANSFKGLQASFTPILKPLADIITNNVIPAIQSLANWFANLSPFWQGVVLAIAGILVILPPLVAVITSIIGTIEIVIGVFTGLAGIIGIVAGAIGFITAPILIAIGVISALIFIGVQLYRHWDQIKAKASEIWNSIGQTIGSMVASAKQKFEEFKSAVGNKINEIKSKVSETFSGIKNTIQEKIQSAKATVDGIFDGIKNSITNKINSAKQAVSDAINAIKGFFNIKLELPHIPLPHFTFSGSMNPMKWADEGVPVIDVNWYAQGGIFNSPSVIGVGEAGTEAVLPIDRLDEIIAKAIEKVGGVGNNRPQIIQVVLPDGRVLAEVVAKNQDVIDRYNSRDWNGGRF